MDNYLISIHKTISQKEAKWGKKLFIERNGKKLEVTIPAGVQSGSKVRLSGALLLTDNVEGDIYVVIKIRDSSVSILAFFGVAIVLIMAFGLRSIGQIASTPPTQQAIIKNNVGGTGKNTSVFVNGKVVILNNNPNAIDPSYSKLMQFLKRDLTDQKEYSEIDYNCVDFAKDLHDNAESSGIKAAWVGIEFLGQEVGHALNAFQTTDRGLVYVDVTSGVLEYISPLDSSKEENASWDKVAYVKRGFPYGVIDIDEAEGTSYEIYTFFSTNCTFLERKIETFNISADLFETAVNKPNSTNNNYDKWADELNQMHDSLIAEIESTQSCGYQTLGKVNNIEIKW